MTIPKDKVNPMDDERNRAIGLAFPLGLDQDGRLSACTYEEHIQQSLRALLLTARGRRVMRPDFGNRLGNYLYENIGETTAALIKNEIFNTVERFEPRVELDDVQIRVGPGGLGTITAEIRYRILSTGMNGRLSLDI